MYKTAISEFRNASLLSFRFRNRLIPDMMMSVKSTVGKIEKAVSCQTIRISDEMIT